MSPSTASRITTATVYPVLPAEDIDRARRFYHETLGFEIEDAPQTGSFLVHAGNGSRILVYERARTKAEHTVATFIVDDLPAAMEDMRSRGVTFEEYDMPGLKTHEGIAEMGGERSAWFVDPEGNVIAVAEM